MKEHPNEHAWIQQAKQGDQEAFAQLVELYQKRVFALTRRMCPNPDHAAEAAQEAFLAAWQGLPFFREESSFSTWLYRLTSNACVDFLRKENRPKGTGLSLDDEEVHLEVADHGNTPHEQLEQKDLRTLENQGLDTLSEHHKEVLVLREMHQRSYDEIAQILDLDVGTVKSRISRGRKQLQKYLRQCGNFFPNHTSKEPEKEGCK